jgi:hypothetical protein
MTAERNATSILGRRSLRLMSWARISLALLLVSCGGGSGTNFGGSTTTTGDTTSTPVASSLLLTLSANSLTDTGSDAITVTVRAVDATRVAIAAVPVTISADNNAVVVAASKSTNSSGIVTATVQIGTDRSNRVINVTATSGVTSATVPFAVIGAKLSASVQQAVIAPGASGQIQYLLTDVNSIGMAGMPIGVAAPGIATVNQTTDGSGAYTYNYIAPATPGNLVITATAGGVSSAQTVIVQSTGTTVVPNVNLALITSASVSANPSVVSVNTASSNNRTEIRALFAGANNAPIPNVRVRFDLNGDVNSVGGSLSSANNVVISDSNGVATTSYIPGIRSSPTNGVTVRACYFGDDASANAAVPVCTTNAATTQLTVVSEPLAVSIGTDNTIADGAGGLTYIKKFVVTVVDASGQAKSGVKITSSIDLVSYLKGFYVTPGAWTRSATPNQATPGLTGYLSRPCLNEDLDRNGVLDGLAEDINGNGQLDPRKSDVSVSMVGSDTTDASGVAILQIQYAKDKATWISFSILVSASGVSGTEGRATQTGTLPAAAGDFTNSTPPAFVVSPYGAGDPADALKPFVAVSARNPLPPLPPAPLVPPECVNRN